MSSGGIGVCDEVLRCDDSLDMFRREGSRFGGSGKALDVAVESAIRGRVKEVTEGVLPGADEVLNLLDMLV